MRGINFFTATILGGLLTACGGGGGSSSGGGGSSSGGNEGGDFSLAQTTANFTGMLGGGQPSAISIKGTLNNASSTVYFMVDASSTPLIQDAALEVSGTSSGTLILVPEDPSKLAIGKQTGKVTVRACKNQSCSSEYSGSPKTITVNYEVTAPDYAVTPSAVNFTTTYGALPEPITVQMTSSVGVRHYGYSMPQSDDPWLKIEDRWSGDQGSATFSIIKNLPVGVYRAKIVFYAHGESLQRVVDVVHTVVAVGTSSSASLSSSSHSVSSSSSSISLPVASGCGTELGDVFFDAVCPNWKAVVAYEQNYADGTINYENTAGNSGNAVHFNIVQSEDAGRNKVLDIKYLNSLEYFGSVNIGVPSSYEDGRDMSEYAHGKIIFDLKVISHSAQDSALEFTIECTWPCASTPKMIKADVLNEWKTYEFSVAELIDRGLDIKRVSLGFLLLPIWEKQDGAHFQIDNVRWVKGEAPATDETICYANFFDDQWVDGTQGVGVSIVGDDIAIPTHQLMYLTVGVIPWVTAKPDWNEMNGTWYYWMSGLMNYSTGELIEPDALSNCSGAGTLSLDIYTSAALVADGKMKFTLQFLDKDNVIHDLGSDVFSVADMRPDDWNKVSVSLSDATYFENLKYVGMRIDATHVSPLIYDARFNIDNIIIKQ